jgi:hypothetical protein
VRGRASMLAPAAETLAVIMKDGEIAKNRL